MNNISPEAVDAMIVAGMFLLLCIVGLIANAIADKRAMRRATTIIAIQEALLRAATDFGNTANGAATRIADKFRAKNMEKM